MSARDEAEGGSERTCVATGAKGPPDAMLRFVLAPDGVVTPDIRRKLPGRGVWTALSAEAVRRAVARGAFARGFREKAEAPADLADAVDRLLERDALQSLSMALKAGLIVSGAFKVDAAIAEGGLAALIQASDAAADGAAKREQALRARLGEHAASVARVKLFSSRQLDLALGKANVIHAALKTGAAAAAFLARAERLRHFRTGAAETNPNDGGERASGRTTEGGSDELAAGPANDGRPDELAEKPVIRNGHERIEQ